MLKMDADGDNDVACNVLSFSLKNCMISFLFLSVQLFFLLVGCVSQVRLRFLILFSSP